MIDTVRDTNEHARNHHSGSSRSLLIVITRSSLTHCSLIQNSGNILNVLSWAAIGIYITRDNRLTTNDAKRENKEQIDELKLQMDEFKLQVKEQFGEVKEDIEKISKDVQELDQRSLGCLNGVYALMQASVGKKAMLKELVDLIEECEKSGGKNC